jgi:hypothetical protein
MSHWSDIQFSVKQRPLRKEEIEQARAIVQGHLAENLCTKKRLHWNFLFESVMVVVAIAAVGHFSPILFSWKWDVFARIFALAVATTFFIQKVFASHHQWKMMDVDAADLLRLQSQLHEISLSEHLQMARDHVFSFEVLHYMNEVNEQGRRLLLGEWQALRDASMDIYKDDDIGGERRYI